MHPETFEIAIQEIFSVIKKYHFRVTDLETDENGRRLFIGSAAGSDHECIVRFLNLDKARSIKILKSDFKNEIKENCWIILGLVMDQMQPVFYMIPLTVFRTPNKWFLDNEQPPRLSHMSNWEIKIYVKAVPQISQYLLESTLAGIK